MFTAVPTGVLTVSEPTLKDKNETGIQTLAARPLKFKELNEAARPEPSGWQGLANAT